MPSDRKSRPLPRLRLHNRGVWFVRWGGRDWYFTKNREESEAAWRDPNGEHDGALVHYLAHMARRTQQHTSSRVAPRRRVIDLAERFLDRYDTAGRTQTAAYYRKHLARFLHVAGRLYLKEISIELIESFREDLDAVRIKRGRASKPLSPTTIGHDLGAIKSMLQRGIDLGWIEPMNLRSIKKPERPPPNPTWLRIEQLHDALALVRARDRRVEPWLALNYLCLIRPTDVVRMVGCYHGADAFADWPWRIDPIVDDGAVIENGVFLLESKTSRKTGHMRAIPLTERALRWLEQAKPHWTRLDSYSAVARAAGLPLGPKALQRSAAMHLILSGASEEDVDLLLGHEPTGVRRRYFGADIARLRRLADRLEL